MWDPGSDHGLKKNINWTTNMVSKLNEVYRLDALWQCEFLDFGNYPVTMFVIWDLTFGKAQKWYKEIPYAVFEKFLTLKSFQNKKSNIWSMSKENSTWKLQRRKIKKTDIYKHLFPRLNVIMHERCSP